AWGPISGDSAALTTDYFLAAQFGVRAAERLERDRNWVGAIHLSFDSLYESGYCFARVLGS
ncbi:MAG: hypothetical protein WCK86_24095, partial [Planctomycetia bacterium]